MFHLGILSERPPPTENEHEDQNHYAADVQEEKLVLLPPECPFVLVLTFLCTEDVLCGDCPSASHAVFVLD